MKLWYIERQDRVDYDEYSDAVIRAETKEDARDIMERHAPMKHYEPTTGRYVSDSVWKDPELVTCVEITHEGEPGIICASFHAG